MKRLFFIALPLLCSIVAIFQSCDMRDISDRKVELMDRSDSLSFAVSMIVGENMPHKMSDVGIDSTTIDDFVRGMCDAFPFDDTPEARAYAYGVLAASSAMEMIGMADEALYPGDTINKVDRRLFLEGLKAMAYGSGKTMTFRVARDYYNSHVFRARSDEFIRKNKERPGVVVLPGGVQYKIETEGTGVTAGYGDIVTFIYKGAYPNGSVFDTSRGLPVEKRVIELVPGLADAVMALPSGTKCKVYVPWERGYGAEGTRKVAPYSALVYDLEIVSVSSGR